ncbi:hypothetical protein [Desertivirga xinjiangensis]|uniref:hypothetical protein n=1 Tax=Desertivirga xinjiangensis TaxID=539206 RepID=UPI00210E5A33|nr:hypothetical protein [Pedobacter xinjiangensis]
MKDTASNGVKILLSKIGFNIRIEFGATVNAFYLRQSAFSDFKGLVDRWPKWLSSVNRQEDLDSREKSPAVTGSSDYRRFV